MKECFEDLYNTDTQEQVAVHMYSFDEVRRDNYFGGKPIRRTQVEERVGKFKNRKASSKEEVMGEVIKGGGNMMVVWIWSRLYNMAFESGIMTDD